jgi:Ca2+-transporting ATPase
MDAPTPRGLSQAEAPCRLADLGPNELPISSGSGIPRITVETMREPMFLVLLGAAAPGGIGKAP